MQYPQTSRPAREAMRAPLGWTARIYFPHGSAFYSSQAIISQFGVQHEERPSSVQTLVSSQTFEICLSSVVGSFLDLQHSSHSKLLKNFLRMGLPTLCRVIFTLALTISLANAASQKLRDLVPTHYPPLGLLADDTTGCVYIIFTREIKLHCEDATQEFGAKLINGRVVLL
jgi:hypothetical protein